MGSNHPMGACASALPRTAMSPLAQRIMDSTTKGNTLPAVLLLADGTVLLRLRRVRSMWNGDGRGVLQHLA